jgi:hypothetical protein
MNLYLSASLLIIFLRFKVFAVSDIPERFLGEWSLGRTENIDEYMIARGKQLVIFKSSAIVKISY